MARCKGSAKKTANENKVTTKEDDPELYPRHLDEAEIEAIKRQEDEDNSFVY